MYPSEKNHLIRYLWSMVGKAYRWGGKGVLGYDCSGLVVEMLKARGFVSESFDATAHGLFDMTRSGAVPIPKPHGLAFYGKSNVSHVGYCISDTYMIEAGGGTANTDTLERAEIQSAMVRLRPIFGRRDFLAVHLPDESHF